MKLITTRSTQLLGILLATLFCFSAIAWAQSDQAKNEQKKDDQAEVVPAKGLTVRLFNVKHRSPSSLANSLSVLGSGAPGTRLSFNQELRTISVRDFPENITAIEAALNRLDVPEQSPISLEFQLHLLSASMTASERATLPKQLEPVVAQLKSTLKFTHYRYISSALNRVSNGGRIESSGVTGSLFPTPAGVANSPDQPSFYRYSLANVKLTQDAAAKETVQIDNFQFGVSVPIRLGGNSGTQYRDIGLVTPLSLREGEMAVVGTANISGSDEAIIVVVSVTKVK